MSFLWGVMSTTPDLLGRRSTQMKSEVGKLEFFHIGYGMLALLIVVCALLSFVILRFSTIKTARIIMVAFCTVLIFSIYFNAHFFKDNRQAAIHEMMDIVGHFDSAVGLLKKGDNVGAATEIATAGGMMQELSTYTKAISISDSNLLYHLGENLEVGIAPDIGSSKGKYQEDIQFIKYADDVFSKEKKFGQFRLSDLNTQLQKIRKKAPHF